MTGPDFIQTSPQGVDDMTLTAERACLSKRIDNLLPVDSVRATNQDQFCIQGAVLYTVLSTMYMNSSGLLGLLDTPKVLVTTSWTFVNENSSLWVA